MALKSYNPVTPGSRQTKTVDYSLLSKKKPEKGLTSGFKRQVGRSHGQISVRHKGGGAKRLYREIDFKFDKRNVPGRVLSMEYDPNRSGFIALVQYQDGEKRYLLAPQEVKVGNEIITAESAPLKPGNRVLLGNIPVGFLVYNLEFEPNKGAQLVRSAGSFAKVMAHDQGYASVELPSGEVRKFSDSSWASIGSVSNPEYNTRVIGKAGRSRWMGIRPSVRGSAMNPVDHPHGGGEGRTGIGLKHPKTPWGKPALGVKTRNRTKQSNFFIIQRRKKK
jgi:large subunit ribosomal protein L2